MPGQEPQSTHRTAQWGFVGAMGMLRTWQLLPSKGQLTILSGPRPDRPGKGSGQGRQLTFKPAGQTLGWMGLGKFRKKGLHLSHMELSGRPAQSPD